jgi:hypothetical protein
LSNVAANLRVKVKPGARNNSLQQRADGSWLAQIKSGAGARLKLLEPDDGGER